MNDGALKFSKKEKLGIKERKNILIKNGFDKKFLDNNLKKIHSALTVSRSSYLKVNKSFLPLHLNYVKTLHR